MYRFCLSGCALGLLCLLTACSQTPSAPPDTRAADEKAIRDGEAAWLADWASKDPAKLASHYADDAVLLVPDMPLVKGRSAIEDALKTMTADKNLAMHFAPSDVQVAKAGDMAYTQGTYTLTVTDSKTKRAVTEKGKYLTVYKKQPIGWWRAVEDMNNADAPAAPVKPAAVKPAATHRKGRRGR
jgi:uncharacterized protein (TIGR02246 family)